MLVPKALLMRFSNGFNHWGWSCMMATMATSTTKAKTTTIPHPIKTQLVEPRCCGTGGAGIGATGGVAG